MNLSIDTWLVVWGGGGDVPAQVTALLASITPAAPNAHYIFSRELEGKRWSLLLIHYTETERDVIVKALREGWDYGFVNAVFDLEE